MVWYGMKKQDIRKELRGIENKISKSYNKYLKKLYQEKKKLQTAVDNQDSKELLGKTFVYRNNSYSCPREQSDYWNVYLKVVALIEDGVRVITVDKDSHGCIEIKTENRYSNILSGYVPCSKKAFTENYESLLKEVEELRNEKD